ncbi:MAG: type II secretion system protein [Magnetococcales bacterium]|nr:type II secretion system protein [Magnetococcales bacterium]
MNARCSIAGFSLIEVIFFIVIAGISLSAITPLYMTVLSNLHIVSDGLQAEFLAQESLESVAATYGKGNDPLAFNRISEANFPTQNGIDIGGTITFDRVIAIEGRIPGKTPDPCTGQPYNGEAGKCVKVTVKASSTGEVLYSSLPAFY